MGPYHNGACKREWPCIGERFIGGPHFFPHRARAAKLRSVPALPPPSHKCKYSHAHVRKYMFVIACTHVYTYACFYTLLRDCTPGVNVPVPLHSAATLRYPPLPPAGRETRTNAGRSLRRHCRICEASVAGMPHVDRGVCVVKEAVKSAGENAQSGRECAQFWQCGRMRVVKQG